MTGKARASIEMQSTVAPTPVVAESMLPATQKVSTSQKKWRRRGGKTTSTPAPMPSTSTSVPAPPPTKKTPAVNISWDGKRTDMLVEWITSHTADRHILFHDRSPSASTTKLSPDDRASGKNKKDVSAAIVKHIFENDPDHSSTYKEESGRYVTSVINRLGTLKTKYQGVLHVFPYYQDLNAIWNGIPSFDSCLVSSKPKVSHAQGLLAIIKKKPSTSAGDEEQDAEIVDECNREAPAASGSQAVPSMEGIEEHNASEDVEMPVISHDSEFAGDVDDQDMEDALQRPGVNHRQANFVPFMLTDKGKTPLQEGRSTFSRHSPYPRPPTSITSGSSVKTVSTRMMSISNSKNPFTAKLDELDKQSEALLNDGGNQTSQAALRYNYTIRKQELDNQHEERVTKLTNAETEFKQEQELKMLELKLKEQEERSYVCQIKLLCLQIQLQQGVQSSPQSTATSGPPADAALPSPA